MWSKCLHYCDTLSIFFQGWKLKESVIASRHKQNHDIYGARYAKLSENIFLRLHPTTKVWGTSGQGELSRAAEISSPLKSKLREAASYSQWQSSHIHPKMSTGLSLCQLRSQRLHKNIKEREHTLQIKIHTQIKTHTIHIVFKTTDRLLYKSMIWVYKSIKCSHLPSTKPEM